MVKTAQKKHSFHPNTLAASFPGHCWGSQSPNTPYCTAIKESIPFLHICSASSWPANENHGHNHNTLCDWLSSQHAWQYQMQTQAECYQCPLTHWLKCNLLLILLPIIIVSCWFLFPQCIQTWETQEYRDDMGVIVFYFLFSISCFSIYYLMIIHSWCLFLLTHTIPETAPKVSQKKYCFIIDPFTSESHSSNLIKNSSSSACIQL